VSAYVLDAAGIDLVGVDVGGTFTDVVAVDQESGSVRVFKVPSTPENQAEGVLAGIVGLRGGCAGIQRIVHGTTVAINTILEGKGASVALVTTAGFRDTIEIGRCRRMVPDSMFDTKFIRPSPLVPRRLRFEVRERVSANGAILTPLAEDELKRAAARIRTEGVTAVAVCFLHAYANPDHEAQAKEILTSCLPDLFICTSSEVLPEPREFERFSTTVVNAYVAPVMRRYIGALARDLNAQGYAGDVYTMASNGGIMNSETVVSHPVRTILSGPASGVNGAIFVGRAAGVTNLITYDMGGTSTDVCLVENLQPLIATQAVVCGMPVSTPQVEIHTVGAGGGSIAWLDIDAALRVGPHSAGAVPGPAGYGRGGTEPTITDANLFLGRLSESLLDGGLMLQPALAKAALARLATTFGCGDKLEWLAEGVIRLTVATMAGAIRKISIERGYDPREFTLVAMGGAGPMHAVAVAAELGIREVMVPPWSGNISALGLLAADLRRDYVRTMLQRLGEVDVGEMERTFAQMEATAIEEFQVQGLRPDRIATTRFADVRFVGQAYELMFEVPEQLQPSALASQFRALYKRRYGHEHDEELELVNLRVAAIGITRKPQNSKLTAVSAPAMDQHERPVYFAGHWHATQFVRRETLGAGQRLEGPAIIEEFGTTIVVPPAWEAHAGETSALFIRPAAGGEVS
jgi:N-methylhydantoinase A